MSYNLLGDRLLFGSTVGVAVRRVGTGGHESTETLISRMGGNVHTTAGEDIVLGNDNGWFVVLRWMLLRWWKMMVVVSGWRWRMEMMLMVRHGGRGKVRHDGCWFGFWEKKSELLRSMVEE